MNGQIEITDNVGARFAEIVANDISSHDGTYRMALSGGSSAQPCYTALRDHPIDWSKIEVFFVDERVVPLEDDRSNAGQADRILFNHLPNRPRIFPMMDYGADGYNALLQQHQPIRLVHLGVGPDGHTASLFPGTSDLDEEKRLALDTSDPSGQNKLPRISMTIPAINACQRILITASGPGKAEILARIQRDEDLPISRITGDRILWLLDQDAAARLN